MQTLFEFLSNESLDNVITCLNYKLDKVVFLGYQNQIDNKRTSIDTLLKGKCQVLTTDYCAVAPDDYQGIVKKMEELVKREIEAGNEIFFDITGGEALILVAFGYLSSKYDMPMHYYDVLKDCIHELDEGSARSISKDVTKRKLSMTISEFIKLSGGIINMDMHKPEKNGFTQQDFNDVDMLWNIICKHKSKWSLFSTFIRNFLQTEDNAYLVVSKSSNAIKESLMKSNMSKKISYKEIVSMLKELESKKVLTHLRLNDGQLSFRYKNPLIKSCIETTGNALEIQRYHALSLQVDDCMIGVHLDWDGTIHENPGVDVCNEIDVMGIKNNVPIFVSCKIGHQNRPQILSALYELDTVACRFGGVYAQKELVILNDVATVYKSRAESMGININVFS